MQGRGRFAAPAAPIQDGTSPFVAARVGSVCSAKRFYNCLTLEPQTFSGFYPKEKPPCSKVERNLSEALKGK